MMKPLYSSLLLLCLALAGCTTTNHLSSGRDFDETKTAQIKKGVTTSDGIVALYGEPDRKQIVSSQQVMWHYSYLNEEHRTSPGFFGALSERTTGYKKELDLLLENDLVINFTCVKVPIQSQNEIGAH
jgi:hypothetical protein